MVQKMVQEGSTHSEKMQDIKKIIMPQEQL
jgi:hypothetical protein